VPRVAKAARSGARHRSRSAGGWTNRFAEIVRRLAADSAEHRLWTYAAAISFRALVALVPLALLGLALLSALGLEDVWSTSVAPAVQTHVTAPVYAAINFSVEKIFSSSTAGLIGFAGALLVWDMTWAVSTVMEALNEIHDVEERRGWLRRVLVALALALAVILCTVGSVLAVILGPRPGGVLHFVFGVGRWPAAILLLSLAVGLLVRFGPAEKPETRWASAGSVLVVGSWILATIGFHWWVSSVANFRTAIGSLTVFLVLSAYLFTSAAIFLVGVQLDELLRKDVRGAK
jgi:membrane protein